MTVNETEADTRASRIDPVLREAGWGVVRKRGRVHLHETERACPQRGERLNVIEPSLHHARRLITQPTPAARSSDLC